MTKRHDIHESYYAKWIIHRYLDEPQLINQQLHDLQTFRSTHHQGGHHWPICRCLACTGLYILQQLDANPSTLTRSNPTPHPTPTRQQVKAI